MPANEPTFTRIRPQDPSTRSKTMSFSNRTHRSSSVALLTAVMALTVAVPPANAGVHYLHRGTKYHIGNDDYSGSVDKNFIDAYPVVGEAWARPFTVSYGDTVVVRIENLWGVDYGNNNSVYIDGTLVGEIGGEDNRKSWVSSKRVRLEGGRTYILKIASHGSEPDDFVFEGVKVETASGATVQAAGPAKILKRAGDNYWTSTYDGGGQASSSGGSSSRKSNSVFQIRSLFPYIVWVEFCSANQSSHSYRWPDAGYAYRLDDSNWHTYNLECTVGDTICFGGTNSTTPSAATATWGSGDDCKEPCPDCCVRCGDDFEVTLR